MNEKTPAETVIKKTNNNNINHYGDNNNIFFKIMLIMTMIPFIENQSVNTKVIKNKNKKFSSN